MIIFDFFRTNRFPGRTRSVFVLVFELYLAVPDGPAAAPGGLDDAPSLGKPGANILGGLGPPSAA